MLIRATKSTTSVWSREISMSPTIALQFTGKAQSVVFTIYNKVWLETLALLSKRVPLASLNYGTTVYASVAKCIMYISSRRPLPAPACDATVFLYVLRVRPSASVPQPGFGD